MALKPKLTALKRQVGKLVASAPRKQGQGAGWLARWRLDDLTTLVGEAISREQVHCDVCHRAIAAAIVVKKEAQRVGLADSPELTALLDTLEGAMDRHRHPPPGTDWREWDVLRRAVVVAQVEAELFLYRAVWLVPPDDRSYPPGGRPPRLRELPLEWYPDEFHAQLRAIRAGAAGKKDDGPP
jgi:hypothetical protein